MLLAILFRTILEALFEYRIGCVNACIASTPPRFFVSYIRVEAVAAG
jgi:hypothetical protein